MAALLARKCGTQHSLLGVYFMKRNLSPIAFSLLALVAAPACNKAPDLSPIKAQAEQLVAQYLPKVQELSNQLEGLLGRAKALPANIPGVPELNKLLADHQGKLGQIKSLLDSASTKVADGIKAGSKEQVTKVVSELTTDVGTSVSNITADIATATTKLGELEAAATTGAAIGGETFMTKLASGFEIKGAGKGIESQALAFIADAAKPIDETSWFNFDRVTFKTGSAEIELDKSQEQLTNIVEILKAYPTASIKIGGYTDKTGDEKANVKLSQERADAVLKAIAAAGIDAGRLAAEGYGSKHPVCEKDTSEECLAQNRRIAIRFTAK